LGIGVDGHPLTGLSSLAVSTDAPAPAPRYMRHSRGPVLLGRRATFYDRGVETPVRLAQIEGGAIERVLVGRAGARRTFIGSGFISGYLTPSGAAYNVITIRASDAAAPFAIGRGTDPVDV